jgi:adenine-specific DNA-methyltransferase
MITRLQKTDTPAEYTAEQVFAKYFEDMSTRVSADTINSILERTNELTVCAAVPRANLFRGENYYINFVSGEQPLAALLDRIAENGKPLSDYFETNQGVVPGAMVFTEAMAKKYPDIAAEIDAPIFIFPKGALQKLNGGKKADFIKPFFKNSDIHRYITETKATKELLYVDGKKKIPSKIKNYLSQFKPLLEMRRECQSDKREWFELQWPRYEELFENPKIVVPYRSRQASFAYSDIPFFAATDVYFITEKNNDAAKLKALLGILNSTLIQCWLYNRGKRKGEMLELFPTALQQIPIVLPENAAKLVGLVDKILAAKAADSQANTSKTEAQIDKLVCELYGLAKEEIEALESQSQRQK